MVRTPIRATPFSLVYCCKVVLPLEIQFSSLRVSLTTKIMDEEKQKQRIKEQKCWLKSISRVSSKSNITRWTYSRPTTKRLKVKPSKRATLSVVRRSWRTRRKANFNQKRKDHFWYSQSTRMEHISWSTPGAVHSWCQSTVNSWRNITCDHVNTRPLLTPSWVTGYAIDPPTQCHLTPMETLPRSRMPFILLPLYTYQSSLLRIFFSHCGWFIIDPSVELAELNLLVEPSKDLILPLWLIHHKTLG